MSNRLTNQFAEIDFLNKGKNPIFLTQKDLFRRDAHPIAKNRAACSSRKSTESARSSNSR